MTPDPKAIELMPDEIFIAKAGDCRASGHGVYLGYDNPQDGFVKYIRASHPSEEVKPVSWVEGLREILEFIANGCLVAPDGGEPCLADAMIEAKRGLKLIQRIQPHAAVDEKTVEKIIDECQLWGQFDNINSRGILRAVAKKYPQGIKIKAGGG